jgi:thioredoxin reductase
MIETAIVGAGPYGLSIAAHLRGHGIPFRIFGRIMDSWRTHMPKGMCLKSDGFASNIYDPNGDFTLSQFCAERGIEYGHTGIPVKLDTFCAYGQEFRDRKVPELEDKMVTSLERVSGGFRVGLDTGETFTARHVVLAVGITHFEYLPTELASLPKEFVTHSYRHHDLEPFRGRNVVVLGAGSSASDMAGLLHEAGANVQLVTRRNELKFHGKPDGMRRTLLDKLRRPHSGIGPGWRLRFFADAPAIFHYLPEGLRLEAVRRVLGPSGGWFAKDKVVGKVPVIGGHTLQRAEIQNGRVKLHLRGADGSEQVVLTDHVIAATGYKVNLERIKFLSPEIRSSIKLTGGSPALSTGFESSVPGLYFAGVSAAHSFGPVMRFAFGAGFAARTVARVVARSVASKPALTASRHQLHEIELPTREKADAATQRS